MTFADSISVFFICVTVVVCFWISRKYPKAARPAREKYAPLQQPQVIQPKLRRGQTLQINMDDDAVKAAVKEALKSLEADNTTTPRFN